MRHASSTLIALLNSQSQFQVADVLTIIPASGSILRYTSASQSLSVVSQYDNLSHTFTPFPFTRGQTRLVIGTEVDDLSLTLGDEVVGGSRLADLARQGYFDNAEILLEKVIMQTFGVTTPGTLILFWGNASTVVASKTTVQFTVQAELNILQNQFPRNVFQPGCLHSLFDAGCTLNPASFLDSVTCRTGSTTTQINTTSNRASTYFDLGVVTFTSGVLNGLSFPVRSYSLPGANQGIFVPLYKMPSAPANGDTLHALPGCDKKLTTCNTKFSNLAHFRGYPVVPAPETAR